MRKNRYGCWDCGCEVPPFQGRCVVCGWPVPPPRPRRRWPMALFLLIAIATAGVGAFFVGSEGPRFLLGSEQKAEVRHHFVMPRPRSALCGNSLKCVNCGAYFLGKWGSETCRGVDVQTVQSMRR